MSEQDEGVVLVVEADENLMSLQSILGLGGCYDVVDQC